VFNTRELDQQRQKLWSNHEQVSHVAFASLSCHCLWDALSLNCRKRSSGWPFNVTIGHCQPGGTYFAYGSDWSNSLRSRRCVGGAEVNGGPVQTWHWFIWHLAFRIEPPWGRHGTRGTVKGPLARREYG